MRIALSCGTNGWGGTERITELLTFGLLERGHEVVLLCRPDSPIHRRLAAHVEIEPVLGGADFHPLTLVRCYLALRRRRPDVVLANSVKDPRWSGIPAKLLGIPFVFRKEVDEPYKGSFYYRFVYGMLPTVHIVNSEATRQSILRSARWLSAERVELIPNGVDVRAIDGAEALDLQLPEDAIAYGFVGRFEPRKGIHEIASAWPEVARQLPNAHLVIAGWGEGEDRFRQELGGCPHVHWIGFRSDVAGLMKSLDVLVAPSHYEGFGMVLVEAMAAETPVVATAVSSIPEIVDHGATGLLVPVRDPARLAAAMIELGKNPHRGRMGEAGRRRVEREFTLERMIEAHELLLQRVVAKATARIS